MKEYHFPLVTDEYRIAFLQATEPLCADVQRLILFQTIFGFFAPKPYPGVNSKLIEAVNECGEKRYIEMEVERNYQQERQRDLEILLTKCKRLLSFVERTDDLQVFDKMARFVVKVRQAKYRGDDIQGLFREFEEIEKNTKRSSKSFRNLSNMVMMMG